MDLMFFKSEEVYIHFYFPTIFFQNPFFFIGNIIPSCYCSSLMCRCSQPLTQHFSCDHAPTCLQALKLQEEHKNTHEKPPGVVVWSHGLGGKNVSLHPAVPSGLELLHAIYTSAYRAKQLHRYIKKAISYRLKC